jgi:hypothetical protein
MHIMYFHSCAVPAGVPCARSFEQVELARRVQDAAASVHEVTTLASEVVLLTWLSTTGLLHWPASAASIDCTQRPVFAPSDIASFSVAMLLSNSSSWRQLEVLFQVLAATVRGLENSELQLAQGVPEQYRRALMSR